MSINYSALAQFECIMQIKASAEGAVTSYFDKSSILVSVPSGFSEKLPQGIILDGFHDISALVEN